MAAIAKYHLMRTTIALDDDLLAKARALTGLRETSALVREALKALIERRECAPAGTARGQRARARGGTTSAAGIHGSPSTRRSGSIICGLGRPSQEGDLCRDRRSARPSSRGAKRRGDPASGGKGRMASLRSP